jgi:dihydroorotate dehydrogenase electron transfer subunit
MCQENNNGKILCNVISNLEISKNIYEMIIETKDIPNKTREGQFVNLYSKSEATLLPRPISICEVDRHNNLLKLVYAVVGKGTTEFSIIKKGDKVEVMGPLGNGYNIIDCEESILVGGGVGVPPLVELAKNIKGKKTIYLGFRTDTYLVEELKKYGDVHVATDDGSYGFNGTVIELMNQNNATGNIIYSCGPKPMLKALKEWAENKQISAQLSLEERMGCGFGACVGCVCKIKANNEYGYTYKKVCKDGPIFDAKEVLFE